MTPEQIAYISGLADALELVKQHELESLEVDNDYYVVFQGFCGAPNFIRKMKLYRINFYKTYSYCFVDLNNPDNKLILHKRLSVQKRVFQTLEDAEKYKDLAFI